MNCCVWTKIYIRFVFFLNSANALPCSAKLAVIFKCWMLKSKTDTDYENLQLNVTKSYLIAATAIQLRAGEDSGKKKKEKFSMLLSRNNSICGPPVGIK